MRQSNANINNGRINLGVAEGLKCFLELDVEDSLEVIAEEAVDDEVARAVEDEKEVTEPEHHLYQ